MIQRKNWLIGASWWTNTDSIKRCRGWIVTEYWFLNAFYNTRVDNFFKVLFRIALKKGCIARFHSGFNSWLPKSNQNLIKQNLLMIDCFFRKVNPFALSSFRNLALWVCVTLCFDYDKFPWNVMIRTYLAICLKRANTMEEQRVTWNRAHRDLHGKW